MSLESSVSFWDAIAFWFITGGVVLAFVGGVASIMFRRYSRQLVAVTEIRNREEKEANEKAIAEANARAAEANRKAEEERLDRIKIEAQLAPRALTGEQATKILAAAEKFTNQLAGIAMYQSVPDEPVIGEQLLRILRVAKWNTQLGLATESRLVIGVLVETRKGTDENTAAAAYEILQQSLLDRRADWD